MAAPFITVTEVDKRFSRGGEIPVLTKVSLDVAQGELVALIGPSGCGKSTLLNIIAGLVKTTSGQVHIAEPDLQIAYVFQGPRLLPWRNVLRNVTFGLEQRGDARQSSADRARQALKLVNLEGQEHKYPPRAVGRHATARGAGPWACHRPAAAPARRALRCARCTDPHLPPGGATRHRPQHRQDHDPGHARHRRGAAARATGSSSCRRVPGTIKHELRVPFGPTVARRALADPTMAASARSPPPAPSRDGHPPELHGRLASWHRPVLAAASRPARPALICYLPLGDPAVRDGLPGALPRVRRRRPRDRGARRRPLSRRPAISDSCGGALRPESTAPRESN